MKVRGFEICEKYKDADINLPKRQTIASAGYDLEAAEDCVIPSIWRLNFVRIFRLIRNGHELNERDYEYADQILQPIMVHTGVKAYMPDDEMLIIANRSSNTVKRRLCLPNSIGVVDSDYYNNPNNEGELMVQMINYGVRPIHIKKGERVAQGIFMKYLRTDDDAPVSRQRIGGFGSTKK
ncbi:dUTP diphosphatase [Lactobacillus mulieris]|uniref:dUTP diphosphatase n=1 Tax=Lactobacillus mulieris TaxID=2508708 RepID=UPI0014330FCF|nr:dUTP diphosphatase [Lactobacillus mulieris]MDK6803471.1 dUTP diphosphatase [Lactobacillus mulieris]MDK8382444.1 dUTP diphosphatase [Lactobacillus mulieris]MDT9620771.1 dUTP diphosphatase [Lactobacillus mulieris]NKC41613.1 dUTP diphosphatase [Lactobacillus mulieris]